jgi:6-phosphogluconate dehydrogenase
MANGTIKETPKLTRVKNMQLGMVGVGRMGANMVRRPHGQKVRNGIEYGIMAACAEGLSIMRAANAGTAKHAIFAETTPLRYQ